jgi:hypothetical protein
MRRIHAFATNRRWRKFAQMDHWVAIAGPPL